MGVCCCLSWTAMCITLFLIILWKISSIARYYLKFILFLMISLVSATLPIPIMLLRPRSSKNALIPAWGLRMSAWLLGLKNKVEGEENIVKDSGCVVLTNHQSCLDLIVLAELWPIMDNCTVISKKEVFYLWPFGLATWLWGTIFINRLNAGEAQGTIMKTGDTIRNKKARVLMFPEGTRSMQENLLPFKKGAFHLAIASQCPIQPVVVDPYTFLGKHRFEEGDMNITILPAIETKGKTKEDLLALIETTYSMMNSFFKERLALQAQAQAKKTT